ncbi:AAA family ATPase [Lentibacter sp. XHP0401]|uniref:AAA family ATPase n=1 Tax=Lentibacter sp. XHP0401 TaxID=2984334 RepID=UPI0021E7D90B|nr:AAA family ATPase [Lentibacter sp. XHP0401]MCV2894514.1 AAA family ATPase [Lentibacter sp. XHP0401]
MNTTIPVRFIGVHLPTTLEESELQVRDRLARSLRKRRIDHYGKSDGFGSFLGSEEEMDDWLETGQISGADHCRVLNRARRFFQAKMKAINAINHIKGDDRKALIAAGRGSHSRGVVDRHGMEERIAALHSDFPWLAPASTAVMQHMRGRTIDGSAPMHTPPLILLGPPGIAKSSWARAVARIFGVASAEVDIGASQGATFSIAGMERGWSSAAPGRVVQTMLRERTANPVIIIDEIDKIPEQIATSKGSMLPGAYEALKSMLEPTSARTWSCPFYQIPFDLSAVSWIMTSNSLDGIPASFLDRCKVVRLGDPTPEQLMVIGRNMISRRLPESLRDAGQEAIETGLRRWSSQGTRISLRMLERMADSISEILNRPRLI